MLDIVTGKDILYCSSLEDFEKSNNILQQNKKLESQIQDREIVKVALFINYVADSLNSITSPSKVPA